MPLGYDFLPFGALGTLEIFMEITWPFLEVHIVLAAGATLMVTFAVVMQLGDFLGHTPTDLFTGMESLFFLWFQTHE